MSQAFFPGIETIRYEGPNSGKPLAFRYYDKDRSMRGKSIAKHLRCMSGAATNPDPEVFAFAAAQVRKILDITHGLKGENYVLWGGPEGYETLLNTDMKREVDQLGRFLALVAEHKHKIGFKGP